MEERKYISVVPTYGKAGRQDGIPIIRARAPKQTLTNGWLTRWELDKCACWIMSNDITEISKHSELSSNTVPSQVLPLLAEIRNKIRGYKEQDKRRGWDPSCVLSEEDIIHHLIVQKYRCWHCKSFIHFMYRDKYDPLQWSVDRLDNDKGHLTDNVVISCMKCNLKRGNKSIRTYVALKSE